MTRERLHALDAARGAAAVGVAFFYHLRYLSGDATLRHPELAPLGWFPGFAWLFQQGEGLVDLFFVLSGFIFCHIYRPGDRPIETPAATYAVNRFARLYPLNLVTMIAAGCLLSSAATLYGTAYGGFIATPKEFLLHTFMLKSGQAIGSFNAAAWSLSVECVCYLIFYVLGRQRQAVFVLGCICLVASGALLQQNWVRLPFSDWWVARGLVGFFAGCLLFTCSATMRRVPIWGLGAITVAGFALSVTNPPVLHHVNRFARLSILAWTPFVAILLRPSVQKGADNAVAKFLGDHSFSIYLIHTPIAMMILLLHGQQPFAPSQLTIVMILDALAVLGMAWLSFRYFESPMQEWLRSRHSSWRERRAARGVW